MSTSTPAPQTKVSFGIPSLMSKSTPQIATRVATVCLYVAAVINAAFLFFPQIPTNVKIMVGEYSASAVGFIHFICNMFGLNPGVPPAPPTATNSGIGSKTAAIVIGLLVISTFARGQSMLKPLPLMPAKVPYPGRLHAVLLPTDSVPAISNGKFQGFRFAGPDIAFAVPDFSVYTGFGIDWVSATANATTGKWSYNWTVGPRVYGGANLGVPTVQAIGAVGIRVTFFNGWLALGGIWNLTTKKAQATIGNPAALIPGLN